MTRDVRAHWDEVWSERAPDEVSWFQPDPEVSLELVGSLDLPTSASVIDVGGGASRLVDHLLDAGYADVTVLDVAEAALAKARQRLGPEADRVTWLVGDVLEADLQPGVQLWHDRAVFHFLTDAGDRDRYAERLRGSLAPGGHAIVATFAPDGPEECSGLPVRRYDAPSLADELGEGFTLVDERREEHATPWETIQAFQYAVLEHRG